MSTPQEDIQTILERCEQLIAKGETEKALSKLTTINNKKYRRQFISLSNQYQTLDRQFKEGSIIHEAFTSKLARLNGAILSKIQEVEANPGETFKPKRKWGYLGLGVVLIGVLAFVVYHYLWNAPFPDCTEAQKISVMVARFQQDEVEAFSNSVQTELRDGLDLSQYRIGRKDFLLTDDPDYRAKIWDQYFKQACDTSGLFLSGLWDKGNEVFNCYIELFGLEMKIPQLKDSRSIILNNPEGISFSVREDARSLAQFVIGLLRTYEGSASKALEVFRELEKDTILLRDPKLKAYTAHFKANCYAMRGNDKKARENYEEAVNLEPKLLGIARANIKTVDKIVSIMVADPELSALRQRNIAQDTITGQANVSKVNLEEDIGEAVNEPKEVEKIKAKLEEEQQQEVKTSEEQAPIPPEQIEPDSLTGVEEDSIKSPSQPGQEEPIVNSGEQNQKGIADKVGEITDRDGNTYFYKTMADGKVWMTANLNVDIPDSYCYKGKTINCTKYGRLYTFEAAKAGCETLGSGWRLPTDEEWEKLAESYGGYYDYGTNKDVGDPKNAYKAILDKGSSGFAALLGGKRNSSGSFYNLETSGYYWSSTERDSVSAWYYKFSSLSGKLYRDFSYKALAYSVRCIKD